MMGRILALDPGSRRVGVAVSDTLKLTAQPHSVLDARDPGLMAAISHLVSDLEVERVVVGLPVGLNGTEGAAAQGAREFAAAVAESCGLPVDFQDERFSTVTAERVLVEGGVSGRRRRLVQDRLAAAVFLQAYLDRRS